MSYIDDVKENENIDNETILNFFLTFSRFEYALKKKGFSFFIERKNYYGPSWKSFGNEIGYEVFKNALNNNNKDKKEKVENAINYLENYPPQNEVGPSDEDWDANDYSNSNNRFTKLLMIIKDVRNNLFHGGKDLSQNLERDKKLIEHSLLILNFILSIENNDIIHDIKSHF